MKLSRHKAIEILKSFLEYDEKPELPLMVLESIQILTAETKLIEKKEKHMFIPCHYNVTECCKVGPITDEKFCPECGKKIIR